MRQLYAEEKQLESWTNLDGKINELRIDVFCFVCELSNNTFMNGIL